MFIYRIAGNFHRVKIYVVFVVEQHWSMNIIPTNEVTFTHLYLQCKERLRTDQILLNDECFDPRELPAIRYKYTLSYQFCIF